jgi:hypothetical protein
MEDYDANGLIDVQKMRDKANAQQQTQPAKEVDMYADSPNKDRSLDTVLIDNINVMGPIRLQHSKDFDITYDLLVQIDKGRLMEPNTVSQFNPS